MQVSAQECHPSVSTVSAFADVLALLKTKIKLSSISEVKNRAFTWGVKPLVHPNPNQEENWPVVEVSQLKGLQHDSEKVNTSEYGMW